MHNRHDIQNVHAGQDAEIPLQARDSDGNAVDMTGGAATMTVMPLAERDKATSDVTVELEKSIQGGGIVTSDSSLVNNISVDPSAGDLAIVLEATDTDSLTPRTYWYRIDATDAAGQTVPGAVAGEFELVRD